MTNLIPDFIFQRNLKFIFLVFDYNFISELIINGFVHLHQHGHRTDQIRDRDS